MCTIAYFLNTQSLAEDCDCNFYVAALFMEAGTHRTHPFRVPPQMSLWHLPRPTATKNKKTIVEHPQFTSNRSQLR